MFIIRSYSRAGLLLAELHRARNISPAYSLGEGKSLTFDIPISDPVATRDILRRGNIIVCWSDELEPWSGFIVKRAWSPGTITVTCYPASWKLSKRRTQPAKLENKTAGELVTHLINEANRRQPSGLVLGSIFTGGSTLSLEMEDDTVLDKLGEVLDHQKFEWKVTMLQPGLWQVDMAEKFGRDLTETVVIFVGLDTVEAPSYEEDDSNFANAITATGKEKEGDAGDSEFSRKPKAEYIDIGSLVNDDLMEDVIDEPEVTSESTLLDLARKEVEKRKWPQRVLSFTLNRRNRLWPLFTDGDIVCVQIPYFGFTGMAVPFRVLGREANPANGTMTVAGEVVVGEDAQLLGMFKNAHYGTGIDFIYPAPTP